MGLRSLPEQVVPSWFIAGLERLDRYLAQQRRFPETDVVLWTVIIVAAIFDVVTTIVGLGVGLSEGNAVAQAFIETYGRTGIGALKLVALVVLVFIWNGLSDDSATIVLAGFAIVSLLVVLLNAITLASI